jgi:putative addiction module component (TIGR02574 family)
MSTNVAKLLSAALLLSPAEREELADRLWATLNPPDGFADPTEDQFVAELQQRAAELKANPSTGVPWDEFRDMR